MELRIKQLRRERRLTQDQLADRAGLSRNYLSQIETGARTPNITRLQQIARALSVDLMDLLVNPEQDARTLRLMSALEGATGQDWEEVIRHAEALRVARRIAGDDADNE
jgi:transcriptional regulator with XRE-family HTH domain